MGDLAHADFGVTHRRRIVAVYRTKVALAINQRVTHRKRLRHTHNGVIHGRVTVRVIFTDHVTDHTGGFFVRLVPVIAQHIHRKQHPAVHRLQAIPHIR